MLIEYVGVLGFILGLFGVGFGLYKTLKWEKEFKPLLSTARSMFGKIGKQTQVDNQRIAELEEGLKGATFEMVMDQYPEVRLVLTALEEYNPEIYDKLMEHPEDLVVLYQRYGHKIKDMLTLLKGKQPQETQISYNY